MEERHLATALGWEDGGTDRRDSEKRLVAMGKRLLFITPKINDKDDDVAFAALWVKGFADAGFEVTVICGEKGETSLPRVHSVGHVQGESRIRSLVRFWKWMFALKYDRVFVHMNTRWLAAGAWYWWLRGIPTYLWFTHYTRTLTFRLGDWAITRLFCAAKESLPHFDGDPRKIVTGHGIDTDYWNIPALPEEEREPVTHLLAVHRISRSKRFDLVLRALALLPSEYTLTHYGRPLDPSADNNYYGEIQALVQELGLADRVRFMGSVPMPELRQIYPRFRVFVNLVPRTIDKSALEAMYCGLTPVLTRGHAEAIGHPDAPADDSPEAIADFIRTIRLCTRDELRSTIDHGHSMRALIAKMTSYIEPGT
jgi:glycosyltransferase involved in cell wall biosynthesis